MRIFVATSPTDAEAAISQQLGCVRLLQASAKTQLELEQQKAVAMSDRITLAGPDEPTLQILSECAATKGQLEALLTHYSDIERLLLSYPLSQDLAETAAQRQQIEVNLEQKFVAARSLEALVSS